MGDVHTNGNMECVNKIHIHLWEPLPLLCCISVTNKAPKDTNTALEDLYVFWKLVCVQFQCSSQEAFHFFGSLPLLWKLSELRHSCATNACSEKCAEGRHHFFDMSHLW